MDGGGAITELRAQLAEQRRELAAQAAVIEALARRLDEVAASPPAGSAPRTPALVDDAETGQIVDPTSTATAPPSTPPGDLRTDRRGMLRTVGVAAAGVATGAVVLGQASPAAAAISETGNPAVLGTASPNTGIGVHGRALGTTGNPVGVYAEVSGPTSLAVRAVNTGTGAQPVGIESTTTAPNGMAIYGQNLGTGSSGIGVYGQCPNGGGTGVVAYGSTGLRAQGTDGFGVYSVSTRAQLRLGGDVPQPTTGVVPRLAGEVVFDANEDLWLCVVSGTPGTWRKISGPATAGALTLLSTPKRVYDSRAGFVPATGPKSQITGAQVRVLDTKNNSSGVPNGATGVLATLTVVNGSGNGGFLAMYAAGQATPQTSTVNWSNSGAVAATTVSAVNASAQVAVYCAPNSSTDLILDIIGYYR